MKKFADIICKNRVFIVILTLILLIPAAIGMYKTKVNYNILIYLPDDIETLKGQNILNDDFNMGAFSVTVVDNMPSKKLVELENSIKKVFIMHISGEKIAYGQDLYHKKRRPGKYR